MKYTSEQRHWITTAIMAFEWVHLACSTLGPDVPGGPTPAEPGSPFNPGNPDPPGRPGDPGLPGWPGRPFRPDGPVMDKEEFQHFQ